ncbi:hypothetical protein ACIQU6_33780 [Streptomyces sp. NPDC090442]|uniref:hypothetical protein n=1 Tax=Streptomyces sp. NPDC090442 TaxID=3365962 RepID=UPI0038017771
MDESGGLQAADLVVVLCAGAGVVIEGDVPPGQAAHAVVDAGVVPLGNGQVVGTVFVR